MVACVYIFAWVIYIASQVFLESCLNSKREKGLRTWVGLNFPLISTKDVLRLALVVGILLQFQSRDILGLALVEGVHQGMGAILDIRGKEH